MKVFQVASNANRNTQPVYTRKILVKLRYKLTGHQLAVQAPPMQRLSTPVKAMLQLSEQVYAPLKDSSSGRIKA